MYKQNAERFKFCILALLMQATSGISVMQTSCTSGIFVNNDVVVWNSKYFSLLGFKWFIVWLASWNSESSLCLYLL